MLPETATAGLANTILKLYSQMNSVISVNVTFAYTLLMHYDFLLMCFFIKSYLREFCKRILQLQFCANLDVPRPSLFWPYKISIFSENISGDRVIRYYDRTMQNFDDLDIEGRNPSHVSEEAKEKVSKV